MFKRNKKEILEKRYGVKADYPRARKARIFSILTIATGIFYFHIVLNQINPLHPFISGMFIMGELASLLLFLTATAGNWQLRFKPPEGLPPLFDRSVDIFITSAGEPFNVVAKTMRHAVAIEWPREKLNIYLLDEVDSKKLRKLSGELGIRYRSRKADGLQNTNAKAGNLNYGLRLSSGDFILILDADQIPVPHIIENMIGYMKFEDVAFIQSQQDYFVPEGDPFYSIDNTFYETVQKAFDNSNTVLSCGSGVMYRRKALESIGGFIEWNLVEDLTTSYNLHDKGWKSFYYPYPLTKGLSPDSLEAVYNQRSQWALDTYRLILWGKFLLSGSMSFKQKLSYFTIGQSYFFSGFLFPIFFIIPIWSYITGDFILTGDLTLFIIVRGVYFLAMFGALSMHFLNNRPDKQFQMLFGLFPVYFKNFFRAFFYPPGRKPGYKANNVKKKKKKSNRFVQLIPQMVLFIANLILPFYAVFYNTAPGKYIMANALVSAICIWSLWHILSTSFEQKRYSKENDPDEIYK